MFEQYINWFENLSLYKDYLFRLPEPLNNPVFLSIFAIFLIISLCSSLINHISSWRFHRRMKAKNRKLEEEKLNQKLREAAEIKERNKDNELFNTYIKFIMMAQMQNMSSITNLTFEQWQHAMSKSVEVVEVVKKTPMEEAERKEPEEPKKLKKPETVNVENPTVTIAVEPQEKNIEQSKVTDSVLQNIEWTESNQLEIEPEIELDLPELVTFEEEEEVPGTEMVQKIEPLLAEESEELTAEQQSDFSKLIAMMQAESRQREQVEEYNKRKTEITRQNAEVLEKTLHKDIEKFDKKEEISFLEDEVEHRKLQVLAVMEKEQLGKQKKNRFGMRKRKNCENESDM